jgi:hypothetical protein
MNPLVIVPLPYRLLALALLAVALVTFGWVKGAGHVQARWDAANTTKALQLSVVKQRQAETTVQMVTKYVDRVKIIRETGATIIKEVPVYVSPEADAACVLPRGFVRLHDAAAAGHIPDPTGSFDAAPAGVALSAAAGTVADNYQRCHENAEQLILLQSWIRQVSGGK